MGRKQKLLAKILSGTKNIAFADAVLLVEAFGFELARISGSHQIFIHPDVDEMVNLQNVKGQAKPYQIRQFLRIVEAYDLTLDD